MKKIRSFNIEEKYHERLKKIAKANKRSASGMIEVLIEMYEKMKEVK